MRENLEVGRILETRQTVTSNLTADRFGNPGVQVLATPALVALIEECAILCAKPTLEEEQGTVGTRIEMKHLAPTPIGMNVVINVELTELEGKRLLFQFQARDDLELIATGTHERYIIGSIGRFLLRAREKARDKS